MFHSGINWIKNRTEIDLSSDPIPVELIGRWKKIVGHQSVFEFTDDGTHSNYYSISDADYEISSDGTTLTWSGFDYTRKFNTSTSLLGVWERFWPDPNPDFAVFEEFNFHTGGTYAAHWRPWNEDYFGTYLENVPTQGKIRMRELNSLVTINGSQITFGQLYSLSRTGNFILDGDTLSIVYPNGTVVFERVP